MAEVLYTVLVERDLAKIGDTIARNNRQAAAAFIDGVQRHCSLLASSPFMGRPRPEVAPKVRSFAHGAYVVYYRCTQAPDRVEVLRVWHARRRTPRAADLG